MSVLFLIHFIPPDHGGGVLRAFRMSHRYFDKEELAGVYTFTNKAHYLSKYPDDAFSRLIHFGRNSTLLLPFELIYYFLSKLSSFDKIYIVTPRWYSIIPILICKIARKKVILGITLRFVDSPNSEGFSLMHKFKSLQFRLADKIVVNSQAVYDDCLKDGYAADKVELLLNPVNTDMFYPISTQEEKINIKLSKGIEEDSDVLLFVGVIDRRKGVDILLEVARRIACVKPKAILIICTNSTTLQTDFGKQFLKELKDATIEFRLFSDVSDIADFYRMSDLFIFPTRNEGLPNVLLEAMACGCNILSNRLEGITDFLLPAEMLIEDNSIEEYVKKGLGILDDTSNLRKLVDVNTSKIINQFSSKTIDAQFDRL